MNHARYRRLIDAYRGKLLEVDPAACDAVDDQVWGWGEKWVVDDRPIDLDRLMSAGEIADRFGFNAHNIRDWARRHPDRIPKHKRGGRSLFRLRDVLTYQAGGELTKQPFADLSTAT